MNCLPAPRRRGDLLTDIVGDDQRLKDRLRFRKAHGPIQEGGNFRVRRDRGKGGLGGGSFGSGTQRILKRFLNLDRIAEKMELGDLFLDAEVGFARRFFRKPFEVVADRFAKLRRSSPGCDDQSEKNGKDGHDDHR